MAEFKVGDRVRLKKRYADARIGTEGVVQEVDGSLLRVDSLVERHAGIYSHRFEMVQSAPRKDAPRVGDTVRVVIEGRWTGRGVLTDYVGHPDVKSIEILEPAKPSVKDLPVGSVVRDGEGDVFLKTADNRWQLTGRLGSFDDAEVMDSTGWALLVPQESA